MGNGYKVYDIILSSFIAVLIISNIVTLKVFVVKVPFVNKELVFDGGALIFPLSYIFADIFTEVYGYKKSRKIIWLGFIFLIIYNILLYITILLPPENSWNISVGQANFKKVFNFSYRIAIAGIVGYFFGEFINSIVLAKMKILSKGKYLFLRVIVSTIFGQLADTTLFCLIAFYNIIDNNAMMNYIITGYFYKVFVETVMSPITIKVIQKIKQIENEDYYDYNTNFNPFLVSLRD
ncbi:MAG: queuosine precursor transporter [bacterium]